MKCLVTGSEGFIGKNLVARLEKDGHEVTGWDIKGDIVHMDAEHSGRYVDESFEAIYHLACANQMSAVALPHDNWRVNAESTRILAKRAVAIGAKFIYTSTASVYGNAEHIPTPSSAREAPITDYAVAKLAGEHFVRNSGADWTILRLSNVYGPHQTLENPYCGVIGRFISDSLAGKPMQVIGDGSQTRDFTYVDDVIHWLSHLGKGWLPGKNEIYNVSRGSELSIYNLARHIACTTGGHWVKDQEKRPIDGIQRRCLIPDLECHTSLSRGIAETVKWFRESN